MSERERKREILSQELLELLFAENFSSRSPGAGFFLHKNYDERDYPTESDVRHHLSSARRRAQAKNVAGNKSNYKNVMGKSLLLKNKKRTEGRRVRRRAEKKG